MLVLASCLLVFERRAPASHVKGNLARERGDVFVPCSTADMKQWVTDDIAICFFEYLFKDH